MTSKGQTTLPKDVREHLGLAPGDKLRYLIIGDEIRILRPRKVASLCGSLRHDGPPVSLDKMAEAVREASSARQAETR